MALIKTDSQNYTNIADAIREVVGIKNIFDGDITTKQTSQGIHVNSGLEYIINNYLQRVGEVFEVIYDNTSYKCELKTRKQYALTDFVTFYYLGNAAIADYSGQFGYEDTGEPFYIYNILYPDGDTSTSYIYTSTAGTHHFTINKKHYKPEEMKEALDNYIPDYGVNFSEDGKIATTYGYKAVGFAGHSTVDYSNSKVETINFSPNTTEIGDFAFADSYLTKIRNITIPEGVKKIGKYAFYNTYFLNVYMPDSLEEIDDYGFYDNTYLDQFNLGKNVKRIGAYAFASSYSIMNDPLRQVTLPDSLVEIGAHAFHNCSNLNITSIPNGVTKIEPYTFADRENITSFTIHKDVTEVGEYAFAYCYDLRSVTFEGTPNKIGKNALYDCYHLRNIYVPWAEGEVEGAPWGATATIHYNYVAN